MKRTTKLIKQNRLYEELGIRKDVLVLFRQKVWERYNRQNQLLHKHMEQNNEGISYSQIRSVFHGISFPFDVVSKICKYLGISVNTLYEKGDISVIRKNEVFAPIDGIEPLKEEIIKLCKKRGRPIGYKNVKKQLDTKESIITQEETKIEKDNISDNVNIEVGEKVDVVTLPNVIDNDIQNDLIKNGVIEAFGEKEDKCLEHIAIAREQTLDINKTLTHEEISNNSFIQSNDHQIKEDIDIKEDIGSFNTENQTAIKQENIVEPIEKKITLPSLDE